MKLNINLEWKRDRIRLDGQTADAFRYQWEEILFMEICRTLYVNGKPEWMIFSIANRYNVDSNGYVLMFRAYGKKEGTLSYECSYDECKRLAERWAMEQYINDTRIDFRVGDMVKYKCGSSLYVITEIDDKGENQKLNQAWMDCFNYICKQIDIQLTEKANNKKIISGYPIRIV
jgi:hypothetical protein